MERLLLPTSTVYALPALCSHQAVYIIRRPELGTKAHSYRSSFWFGHSSFDTLPPIPTQSVVCSGTVFICKGPAVPQVKGYAQHYHKNRQVNKKVFSFPTNSQNIVAYTLAKHQSRNIPDWHIDVIIYQHRYCNTIQDLLYHLKTLLMS